MGSSTRPCSWSVVERVLHVLLEVPGRLVLGVSVPAEVESDDVEAGASRSASCLKWQPWLVIPCRQATTGEPRSPHS